MIVRSLWLKFNLSLVTSTPANGDVFGRGFQIKCSSRYESAHCFASEVF